MAHLNIEQAVHKSIDPATMDITESMDKAYIRHLASIVESSEDAIISKSLDGTIKSWNKGSEKMFGYTSKEIIGKNISLVIPPEFIVEEQNILERLSKNEIIDSYEAVRIKKNGEKFYISLTVSALKDQTGKIIGISNISRDTTSRKKTETNLIKANLELAFQIEEKEKRADELIVANIELVFQNKEKEKRAIELSVVNRELKISDRQLKEANKELEAFSYSVSHDLRTPLRAVSGFSSMLKKKYESKLDKEANRIIDVIVDNTTLMGKLIDDLLTFSKMARLEAMHENIDMKQLAETCISGLMQIEKKTDYVISVYPMPMCKGDAAMLKQVWYNLISNSIKYSSKKDYPNIEIGTIEDTYNNVYYIKDNGAGFNMKYADKLFGVFQRLHKQSEFEGTGLGLALVKRIISKHDGTIWAESILNEGTTFYFSIPK